MCQPFPNRALLVDLYELTMAAGYFEHRMDFRATFELFVRSLPAQRSYLVAAGVDDALDYLETLRFSDDDVRYLRSLPAFRTVSAGFFDYLRAFRFTGEVAGVTEGTLIFGEEPILQVTAPVAEAQIVETYLLSLINFETLVASKAARVVRSAAGRRGRKPACGQPAPPIWAAAMPRPTWRRDIFTAFPWPVRPRIPGRRPLARNAKALRRCWQSFRKRACC